MQSINKGFAADHARQAKALKILKLVEDAGKGGNNTLKLLDIGTGNGAIAFYLAQYFDVTSVDAGLGSVGGISRTCMDSSDIDRGVET